ncbi:MAG: hypothetical protein ACYTEQ_28045, partial [Planctomycetota bacterium]
AGIERERNPAFDIHLMVWNNGDERIKEQTHGVGHNVGQHVSMNRMLDEAVLVDADYFVRVDEDCFFETRGWLKKMLKLQQEHLKKYKRICMMSPVVHGLRNPLLAISRFRLGKYEMDAVDILGGICRMAPMSLLRYWRFDERSPMGFGDATSMSRFCKIHFIPQVRCLSIHVSHGESTDAQEAAAPEWAHEHSMLQVMPYGL